MQPPEFWHRPGLAPTLLAPLGLLYGAAAALRARTTESWTAPVPVICVGNLTVGGTGKTPTALAVAAILQSWDLRVAFLSRGYGGRLRGPVEVDPAQHDALAVGDEPLLLAARAPTWIARDRKDGARAAIAEGVDVIVMDDGLQNPSLRKDLRLVVVDGGYGFGNECVLPAGPLRENLGVGLRRASAFVLIGADDFGLKRRLAHIAPVLTARIEPDEQAHQLRGKRVFAFAGIGRPAKFFATLETLGVGLAGTKTFADHHPYHADEAMALIDQAKQRQAIPVTTAKDFVRLPEDARALVTPVRIDLVFDDVAGAERLLRDCINSAATREERRG